MEVILLESDNLPAGCVLSVHAGSSTQQMSAIPDKACRIWFPKCEEQTEKLRVDLLAPLGSTELPAETLRQHTCQVQRADGTPMRFSVSVRKGATETSQEPTPAYQAHQGVSCDSLVIPADAKQYLADCGALMLMQGMLDGLAQSRPNEPAAFIEHFLAGFTMSESFSPKSLDSFQLESAQSAPGQDLDNAEDPLEEMLQRRPVSAPLPQGASTRGCSGPPTLRVAPVLGGKDASQEMAMVPKIRSGCNVAMNRVPPGDEMSSQRGPAKAPTADRSKACTYIVSPPPTPKVDMFEVADTAGLHEEGNMCERREDASMSKTAETTLMPSNGSAILPSCTSVSSDRPVTPDVVEMPDKSLLTQIASASSPPRKTQPMSPSGSLTRPRSPTTDMRMKLQVRLMFAARSGKLQKALDKVEPTEAASASVTGLKVDTARLVQALCTSSLNGRLQEELRRLDAAAAVKDLKEDMNDKVLVMGASAASFAGPEPDAEPEAFSTSDRQGSKGLIRGAYRSLSASSQGSNARFSQRRCLQGAERGEHLKQALAQAKQRCFEDPATPTSSHQVWTQEENDACKISTFTFASQPRPAQAKPSREDSPCSHWEQNAKQAPLPRESVRRKNEDFRAGNHTLKEHNTKLRQLRQDADEVFGLSTENERIRQQLRRLVATHR